MSEQDALNSAREAMAARRQDGDFASPHVSFQFKPHAVRLLSINQDGSQAFVEYPDGVREAINASEVSDFSITKWGGQTTAEREAADDSNAISG
jgi:hypothetical protein